jgi:signal peptidase II
VSSIVPQSSIIRAFKVMTPWVVLVLLIDQITKHLILESFAVGERLTVVPGFFDLTLTFNKGAAFGFLAGVDNPLHRHLLLGMSTMAAFAVVFYLLLVDFRDDRIAQCAIGAIVGGALGNVIDRFRFGAVVDFLDFYLGRYHYPVFNAADSAICIGVAILVIPVMFERFFRPSINQEKTTETKANA